MTSRDPVTHLRELAAAATLSADTLGDAITRAAELMRGTVRKGGTLFFCGNGGSAADAQHLATEYVVRYSRARRAIAAIALTTDSSLLTAAANDFSFDVVFARQIEALGRAGDLLVIHTTSGNSPNLLRAVEAARRNGVQTLAFSARGGGAIAALVDHCVVIPVQRTDRAQELQMAIQHAICELIDDDTAA